MARNIHDLQDIHGLDLEMSRWAWKIWVGQEGPSRLKFSALQIWVNFFARFTDWNPDHGLTFESEIIECRLSPEKIHEIIREEMLCAEKAEKWKLRDHFKIAEAHVQQQLQDDAA